MTSLRLRLVIGFMLVSVPAMLASAFIAAKLISDTFEDNVGHWLRETSRFFALEVSEAAQEAQRVAGVIGHRLERSADDARRQRTVEREFAVLNSVGYDLIAIYRPGGELIFSSRRFASIGSLPEKTGLGLFKIAADDKRWIMAGAVQSVQINGQPANLLVGSWLDDSYLGGIKVVTSLDVRLFSDFDGELQPVVQTHSDRPVTVPDNIRARLDAGEDEIFDPDAGSGAYRAVYAGFRGIDGKLAAISFIGLRSEAGFFEQLSRERLFLGIFLLGCFIAVLVGSLMSDVLVRPLRALTRGVRAIAAGDFGQRVGVGGGREIAELANGFNGMAEQLGKLHELEMELRRSDRLSALGQAAMVIAHEVRNPLGIIKTSTEVVRNRAKLGETEAKMLGYVIDEVRRIETLMREFLDFAQPRPLVQSCFPLRNVIDRVAAIAEPELARRNIVLRVEDGSGGAEILGDADQLHQACLNLVLNAMDAMPAGGTIFANLAADAKNVSLAISDEGPGVPKAIRTEIFNPFFTTKVKGTGLGLAKVQGVAVAHGGTASCEGEEGQGAVFVLALPRAGAGGTP
ncbi:ATP-binding protein [uncultured Bosea sp.]|uniref:sensor histidine kinase n=1 Tax=uncultured Bosea sp. TaxID=211457 RepID=UPI00263AF1EF|nr:ATP-binding protein [uncultured Bosea sp.]